MGGAYLSRPVKDKYSEVGSNSKLSYGVSSMQGWRLKQEDAHNCIIDFDENVSFFGVYDGHGGFEVAKYTSENFPNFLKNTEKYKQRNFKNALIEAFLDFDDIIPTPEVMAVLKDMVKAENGGESECDESAGLVVVGGSAGCSSSNSNECDDDFENPETLRADANKPIEEVMASYQVSSINVLKSESAKPSSPYLRGRRESTNRLIDDASCSSSTSDVIASKSKSDADAPATSSSNGSEFFTIPEKECTADVPSGSSFEMENKRENSVNGALNEINGDGRVEANSSDDLSCKISGISPKKVKKLALDDLNDSTIIKNFITNDEIAEDDEDDSEDETFLPADDTLDSDDDEDDNDFELSENNLAKRFLKCLHQVGTVDDDDDDSEDDDENNDKSEDDAINDDDDDKDSQSGDSVEEDDLSHEYNLEEESGEDSECDEEIMTAEMMSGISEKPGIDSGCTAVVALLQGDNLYVANAGDSRCIVCKAGQAVDMSNDHKPEDKLEHDRIVKAGGNVTPDGRVNGGLNLSRAIGDHCYKKNAELPNTDQMITALPDVQTMKLEPDVEFLVLACDGIWNSMTSQEVVDFVRPKIQENMSLSSICEQLFDKCLAPDTWGDGTGCDNMTCIIVKPICSRVKTSTLANGTIESSIKIEAVNMAGDNKTSSKSENIVLESVAKNEIAGLAESLESAENGEEQQCNGLSSDDDSSAIQSALTSKAQKRCAEVAIVDDHNKRQKTDNTNFKSSLQAEKTFFDV